MATDGVFVDVCLDDSSPNHSRGTGVETCRDLLDGGEMDTIFSQEGVDEEIADGDEDDER